MTSQANGAPAGHAAAGAAVPPAQQQFPDYRVTVPLKYVKLGYSLLCRHALAIVMIPLAGMMLLELSAMQKKGELLQLWILAQQTELTFNFVTFVTTCIALGVVAAFIFMKQSRPVYLVDYAVSKPPDSWKMDHEKFKYLSAASEKFTPASLEFQNKIIGRSGLGQETYLPPAVHCVPPQTNMESARQEFEDVVFPIVQQVLEQTGVSPRSIGVLVVNCSLFCPTPSLTAMIINRFKLRSNVISYNLGGMGCSAGVIAIDLARQSLQVVPNTYALVVSTENITQNWYFGNERSMLVSNCIFRAGAAAMLMSNKSTEYWRAKYELLHAIRTHLGGKQDAYSCVFQKEDPDKIMGVQLSKELMAVAGEALKTNITTLGPLVLPLSEQLLFFGNLIMRKVLKMKVKPYIPDFQAAFDHICIHTGGRAVIDEIEKQLKLDPKNVEPSRAVLYRFGNVSSSSVWYVLSYMESKTGVRRGDRVWQLAFGSGFKCNSAVWRALRPVKTRHAVWE